MPPRKRKEPKIISIIKTIKDLAEWVSILTRTSTRLRMADGND